MTTPVANPNVVAVTDAAKHISDNVTDVTKTVSDPLMAALHSAITATADGITTATAFLSNEIPEVVQQLLWWEGTISFINFIIGILFLVAPAAWWYYGYKMIDWSLPVSAGYREPDRENSTVAYFVGGFAGTGMCVLISSFWLEVLWLKILIAPKIFLIEYAAHLIK